MSSVFSKLNPAAFFIALCMGLLLCYITNPPPQILIKYPFQDQNIKKRKDGSCFRYTLEEVECPRDEKNIEEMEN